MSKRKRPPERRKVVRQKIKIKAEKGERTVYLDVHDAEEPLEFWLRVKGCDLDAEKEALYNCLARAYALALQYGAPLEEVGKQLMGVKGEPAGPVVGDDRIKNCLSVMDFLGRHILIWWCGQDDLAHAPKKETAL